MKIVGKKDSLNRTFLKCSRIFGSADRVTAFLCGGNSCGRSSVRYRGGGFGSPDPPLNI